MRLASRKLTADDAAIIKALIAEGWLQSDIASLMGCNSGRIAEISTRLKFAEIEAADLADARAKAALAIIQVEWLARKLARALKKEGGA